MDDAALWQRTGSRGEEIRQLLQEFYARMRAAGNPGLKTYRVRDLGGLRSVFQPRVQGWPTSNDCLLTIDGRHFMGQRGRELGEVEERVWGGRDAVEVFVAHAYGVRQGVYHGSGITVVKQTLDGILRDHGVR